MKRFYFAASLALGCALWLSALPVGGITFTNNTSLGLFDTNYDGTEVVVSNCTLTVDGPHSFSNLLITAGGSLTHTFSPNGIVLAPLTAAGEPQILISTNVITLLNSGMLTNYTVTDLGNTVTYTNGVDYLIENPGNSLVQLQRTTNSTIPDGATVLVNYTVLVSTPAGLNLTVAGAVEISAGATINVNGTGFGGNGGTGNGGEGGAPPSGAGAGHGGLGGNSSDGGPGGITYGLYLQPATLGSGGGYGSGGTLAVGGAGGGAIKLLAGGNLILNGVISANGVDATNSRSGGGAGGSIWLSTQTILGNGSISANGGAGEPTRGGGGGGGRIAVYCGTNLYSGTITNHGGIGFVIGGAGTTYIKVNGQTSGQLVLDNQGLAGAATSVGIVNGDNLSVIGNAQVQVLGHETIHHLLLGSNSWFNLPPYPNGATLTVTGDATFQPGGGIRGSSNGPTGGQGTGFGSSFQFSPPGGSSAYYGTGAGHGGYGAQSLVGGQGGIPYGSLTAPTTYGSGGGNVVGVGPTQGGFGGGVIRLIVSGTLTLDGNFTADGGPGIGLRSGGGSAGSVWVTVGLLTGTGSITANGGDGNGPGGGGSGGRIAIEYGTNTFAGTVTALGGGGGAWGAAGTIFKKSSAQRMNIVVDNGGRAGTNTSLGTVSTMTTDLSVSGGANLTWPIGGTFQTPTVLIGSNSLLQVNGMALMTIASNLVIQSGGVLTANGTGFTAGQGTGAGGSTGSIGGGAGYGGRGTGNTFFGGNTYGSVTQPIDRGSGGGNGVSSFSPGGPGGGAIQMNIAGGLQLDGRISANGFGGSATSGGGGSGGSLWITAGTISGSGVVSAAGGNGAGPSGGGGGGGRIAIYFNTNNFTGTISALGGTGVGAGGAGTIFFKTNSQPIGLVVIDNGGQAGTNSSLGTGAGFDVTLSHGGILLLTASQTIRNLEVGSNSFLVIANGTKPTLTVSNDAVIRSGGGMLADGGGIAPTGNNGVGGSYGGYGAVGSNSLPFLGFTFGSPSQPTELGNGGGPTTSTPGGGGFGGGAIRLIVNGQLTVDGKISARGLSGTNNSALTLPGGGSGGSIWLTVGTLSGSGTISANGGAGVNGGGGGGGGRIAIYYGTNLFSGITSAYGGSGYRAGGAGTVYVRVTGATSSLVLIDNGGLSGTNTPLTGLANLDNVAISGAGIGMLAFSQSVRSLLLQSNGWMSLSGQSLSVINDVTILAGGGIVADGKGSGPASGSGAGNSSLKTGAAHGGYGGATNLAGGNVYGLLQSPTHAGSGGGNGSGTSLAPFGGSGGGVIRLQVPGVLSVDGKISADGLNGDVNSGGGSGGSVWLTVGTLAGNGIISVNGGAGGGGAGGGGAGGRISIGYDTNNFSGTISAHGGGTLRGGAGTIYTKASSQTTGQIRVDNGGASGSFTPLSSSFGMPSSPFDLAVQSGATLFFSATPGPVLSNLVVNAGGRLTALNFETLTFGVIKDLTIASGGAISADRQGFLWSAGPGVGGTLGNKGAGGGYGGMGGASASGAVGGLVYGSSTQPVDRGSGGGGGANVFFSGSEGGGAIRLSVGGTATVNGVLSANGNTGLQDDSGGGSGGSVWITATALTGNGIISADGGDGDLYGGGGGGGGRIAIYAPSNTFAGLTSVAGGIGAVAGEPGTLFLATNLPAFEVASQTPTGAVSNTVAFVDLDFNDVVDKLSVAALDFVVTTPNGPLSPANLTTSASGLFRVRVSFPPQNLVGDYRIEVGPGIQSLPGQAMSQVYTGAFTVALPIISGTITNSSGLPVPGVSVQPDGFTAVLTDSGGNYSFGVPVAWNGSVVPSLGTNMFVPGSRTYANVTESTPGGNYLMVPTIAPSLSSGLQNTNLLLSWQGIPGVIYQLYYSTNLAAAWLPYGNPIVGSNAIVQIPLPVNGDPLRLFQVRANN